jgi:hypothetical protein
MSNDKNNNFNNGIDNDNNNNNNNDNDNDSDSDQPIKHVIKNLIIVSNNQKITINEKEHAYSIKYDDDNNICYSEFNRTNEKKFVYLDEDEIEMLKYYFENHERLNGEVQATKKRSWSLFPDGKGGYARKTFLLI